jgi:predicted enzyme related to lactoylglutathione lyase
MKRVTGIGGIFFKSPDPATLFAWYEKHLGLKRSPDSPADSPSAAFEWRDAQDPVTKGMTVWAVFARASKYFDPSPSSFMINYRVEDLDALLEALKREGVEIDPHREDYDYGRFAWIMDPEGNRIELWEPQKPKP